jgi:hypothetical protein
VAKPLNASRLGSVWFLQAGCKAGLFFSPWSIDRKDLTVMEML